jgi:hypothetical protein
MTFGAANGVAAAERTVKLLPRPPLDNDVNALLRLAAAEKTGARARLVESVRDRLFFSGVTG